MLKENEEKAFYDWVLSEDSKDGLFSNKNSFSRDLHFAEHGFEAGVKYARSQNAKLKAIVMLASDASCYTEYEDACSLARQVLKEIGEE